MNGSIKRFKTVRTLLTLFNLGHIYFYLLSLLLITTGAFGAQNLIGSPHLNAGSVTNISFKSKIDGSIQSFLAKIPKDYTPDKKWPLLVTLHGLGDGPILAPNVENILQIGPHGRGSVWFSGIGEKDIFECIEATQNLFSVDEERLYLCGFSMGAFGTFNIGLKYPHLWAACVPVCGRCNDIKLIQNAKHLPFWINAGERDTVVPAHYSQKALHEAQRLGFEHWKYTEFPNMAHSFNINWPSVEKWLLTKKRLTNPKTITLCTKNLTFNRAYWLEITRLEEYGQDAEITAEIQNQDILITNNGVSNYRLRLNNKLLDLSRRVRIIENDKIIFTGLLDKTGRFEKSPIDSNETLKRPGLSGPLWDIYSSTSLLVYGTGTEEKKMIDAARRCARSFTNPRWISRINFKTVSDKSITPQDIGNNNIVLFGNESTNSLLARISDKLPLKLDSNSITIEDKKYSAEHIGYCLIYPNPLNPEKYVAVFSGNTPEAINCFDTIWPSFRSMPRNIDVGIFKLKPETDSLYWLYTENFSSNWTLQ